MRRIPFLLTLFALGLPAADPLFDSANHKLDLVQGRQAQPGSVIVFTPDEINAWARVRVPQLVPDGIRNPRVELGPGTATGSALVDFLKMRQAKGETTNRLMAKLIEGERPVKVELRVQSASGRCTVFLTQVELSSVEVNGTVLDFLINTFFLPLYPDAKIDTPFDLDFNINRIEIRPSGVRVTIKN